MNKLMTFKELAFQDIQNVFLNPQEFGENHLVDGKEMTVSIDGLEVIERGKRQSEQGRIDGIYKRQIIMYVSRAEFGRLPAVGRELRLDKSIYRVMEAIDEGGMYSITLGAIKS